jgi:DNA-binding MarR family transcriptional regulator
VWRVAPTTLEPVHRTSTDAERLLGALAAVRRRTRRLAGRPGLFAALSGSQLELVRLVGRRPGVSVAEAADELRLAANTVSTLVGQLTEAGLLVRRPDEADRRVARLDLEAETRRRVSAWRDRRAEGVATALRRLTADDRRLLLEAAPALERLADAIALEEGAAR